MKINEVAVFEFSLEVSSGHRVHDHDGTMGYEDFTIRCIRGTRVRIALGYADINVVSRVYVDKVLFLLFAVTLNVSE